jgi:imidazolonepropionase-like amidohydrolase
MIQHHKDKAMTDDDIMAVFDQANMPVTLVTTHAEWHKAVLLRFGRLMLAEAAAQSAPAGELIQAAKDQIKGNAR